MILDLYQLEDSKAIINQLPINREWMDIDFNKHSYHCLPMTIANRLGWGVSFTEDISFIWDGTISTDTKHIEILQGGDFCSTRRGNRTVSLDARFILSPYTNVSILTTTPPNYFFEDFECVNTITSTSALVDDFPIAIMAKTANKIITIKAGTPVATLIPISLTELNNTELLIKNYRPKFMSSEKRNNLINLRNRISNKMNAKGKWAHFYRDAIDPEGNKFGEHEAKKIIMRVNHEN